ncbi:MAG: hypothetical protein R3F11_14905 [Verrucomicrobiales bacterium]
MGWGFDDGELWSADAAGAGAGRLQREGWGEGGLVSFADSCSDYKWDINAGAGYRTISADFRGRPVDPYAVMSLVRRRQSRGDLGLASDGRDARYIDGAVYGASGNYGDGTADFRVNSPNQVLGRVENLPDSSSVDSRQLMFRSETFGYDTTSQGFGRDASDEDGVLFPYVEINREIADSSRGEVNIGLGYSFTSADFDSGLSPAYAFFSAFETAGDYRFIYDLDPVFSLDFSGQEFPFDSSGPFLLYAILCRRIRWSGLCGGGHIRGFGPAADRVDREERGEAGGGFVQSQLEVEAHELTLPLSVEFDLGDRVHVGLSAGYRWASIRLSCRAISISRSRRTSAAGALSPTAPDSWAGNIAR